MKLTLRVYMMFYPCNNNQSVFQLFVEVENQHILNQSDKDFKMQAIRESK